MACCFALLLPVKTAAGRQSSPFAFSTASSFALPPLPDPFSFCSRSVPFFTTMIFSDSDSASPSSNSRQADQSASGRDPDQTQSSQPSLDPSTGGPRVKMDENIMALCHCQITDRGFANATDMVGPSIELVPNSHRYIAGYLVRCKAVGVKPTLDHFLFTFKLTKGHGDWASYASLSQRSSKLFTSDKKGSTKDWKPFFVFVPTGPESPFMGSGLPSFRRVPSPPFDATLLSITRQLCGQGAFEIKKATLGMIEVVSRRQDRQAAMDEARKAAEDKQRELQEEVAHFARELEEEKGRSTALETEKASLSARVAELEGEKTNLIQQLEAEKSDRVHHVEEAIESFKSSPDFDAVSVERMDKLVAEWLKTGPSVQWMFKEGKKSFNCGLFRAQQVFRNKLARLPKGFSFPDLGFPPPCRALAEFDPSPYLDEGSSSASDEEEEEVALNDQGGQGDQDPGANLTTACLFPKSVNSNDWGGGLDPYEFCLRLPRRQWPSVKPLPIPPNPYDDFSAAYKALSANRLPNGQIDWDAPCPTHLLHCMAWESVQNEHLPLLEHEGAYLTSLEQWTSESRTNSPVRLKEEVVVGEELDSSLPRPTGRSPPQKAPSRSGATRAASGSPSSSK
ncbi:unnamed protein product [Cuscuta campestris]|uniref:Uncharacterized protein n=1 Tax=Cuscuta campestris TaxID=132261 RepID=A0A484LZT7_9ASTE|nr:unnamed protein product [Cuscuta campestris]